MNYSALIQAKNAPAFLYTKSDVAHSADVYLSRDLQEEIKLSSLNSQQQGYNWFTAELTHWTMPKATRPPACSTNRITSTRPNSTSW